MGTADRLVERFQKNVLDAEIAGLNLQAHVLRLKSLSPERRSTYGMTSPEELADKLTEMSVSLVKQKKVLDGLIEQLKEV